MYDIVPIESPLNPKGTEAEVLQDPLWIQVKNRKA